MGDESNKELQNTSEEKNWEQCREPIVRLQKHGQTDSSGISDWENVNSNEVYIRFIQRITVALDNNVYTREGMTTTDSATTQTKAID